MSQQQRRNPNQFQAEDDLLMEFVLAPDDPSGKKILRTPMRINVEDLARPGGVNVTTTDAQGNKRQTTVVVDEDFTDSNHGDDDDLYHHNNNININKAANNNTKNQSQQQQQQHRAEVIAMNGQSQYNPIDQRAMEQMRRENERDAVEGRQNASQHRGPTARTAQFVDGEWARGTFVASTSGRPADLDDDERVDFSKSQNGKGISKSQLAASMSVIGAGGVLVDDGREQGIKVCATEGKRSFGPPPLRRFAATGYTNAIWGGDGARRLLVCGGLSKAAVEHEVYEYGLCGQRWRRLECRAEAFTPQGLPIVPLARHSHTASTILESGQGGDAFMVIFGGVGLDGRVVPADALETTHSRKNFEELFGTDPETFAKNLRNQDPQLHVCSVLDLISGETNAQRPAPHHHAPNTSMANYSRDHTPSTKEYDGYHEPGSHQPSYQAGTLVHVGGASAPSNQVGVLDDVFELNLRTRLWKKISVVGCAPPHLCEHTAVAFGNRIIVFGGTSMEMLPADGSYLHFLEAQRNINNNNSRNSSTAVSASRPNGRTYEWSMRALEPAPPARSRHTAVASSPDTMTVFGGVGTDGQILGDLWMLHEANSHEPFWVKIQLAASTSNDNENQQQTSNQNKKKKKPHHDDSSSDDEKEKQPHHEGHHNDDDDDKEHKRDEDERLQKLYGRSGHSACMSYGHRLLIVGGQAERGVVSTIIEIQLGRAIVDMVGEAVCRTVKVGGDAIPRFCFGSAVAAGDGVSGVIFGGQKTWKEDLKKLQMLKNPTPDEIARSRRKPKDQETLTNSVFVFTYPELTGKERKKFEHKMLKAAKRQNGELAPKKGSDDDGDDDESEISWDDESNKVEEVPESFLKFVNRAHKGFKFTWENVKKEQQNIDNEAKIYASTRILITKQQAEELIDLLTEASGFLCEQRPEERIDSTVADRDDRIKGLDQTQVGIQQAMQVTRLKKGREGKQVLHYIAIEQNLHECHTGLAKLRKIQKAWNAPPHMKQWSDDHDAFVESATEKITAVSEYIRKAKKAVVDGTLKRIHDAQEKAKYDKEQDLAAAKRRDDEMLSKTAMEHILEERKKQSRTGSSVNQPNRAASWGKPPPKRTDSPNNGSKKGAKQGEKKTKSVATYQVPEYGDQIPDLEIVVIKNDRDVHSRLVRVCRHEIATLKKKIDPLSSESKDQANFKKFQEAMGQFETQIGVIEKGIPAAPEKEARRPNYSLQQQLAQPAPLLDETQILKSTPFQEHVRDLVGCGKEIKKIVGDDARLFDQEFKSAAENLDKVSRAFRQYWHMTFLTRGYGKGRQRLTEQQAAAAAAGARAPSRPSSSSRSSSVNRGPPRCAAVTTGNLARRSQSPVVGPAHGGSSYSNNSYNRRPGTASSSSNRPPLAVNNNNNNNQGSATTSTRPVIIEPLPANSAKNVAAKQPSDINTHGTVNWNHQQQQQQAAAAHQQQQQNPGSWAIQSLNNNNNMNSADNNNNNNGASVQSNQGSTNVPSSSQVDWIRGNDRNGNNIQIAPQQGHHVSIVPTGSLPQQQQQENQFPGGAASSSSQQQDNNNQQQQVPSKPKPKTTSSTNNRASTRTSQDNNTLFRGTRNLTPGERKILEARTHKN